MVEELKGLVKKELLRTFLWIAVAMVIAVGVGNLIKF